MTVELASRLNSLFSIFSKHKQVGHPAAAAGASVQWSTMAIVCITNSDTFEWILIFSTFSIRISSNGSNGIIWSRYVPDTSLAQRYECDADSDINIKMLNRL